MNSEAALRDLAEAAVEHARREHGTALDPESADRILRAEVVDADRLETLAACYGAWLGELARQRWGAVWVGLEEPVAPRLGIGQTWVSPVDAVRRRLTDPFAPTISSVLRELERLAVSEPQVLEQNRAAWNALAADPRFAGPLPQLSEDALDPWLREEGVKGKELLCLAAGGGRQGPLHAAAGARVTVVDFSEAMLVHDRRAGLRTLCASLDRLDGLADASFDIVVQPVSACYVPDVGVVHRAVARILRKGGLYVVQHKQPGVSNADPGTREFAHPLEDLIGGLCRAGFVIEDFREPPRGDALAPPGSAAREACVRPPYLKLKARRI